MVSIPTSAVLVFQHLHGSAAVFIGCNIVECCCWPFVLLYYKYLHCTTMKDAAHINIINVQRLLTHNLTIPSFYLLSKNTIKPRTSRHAMKISNISITHSPPNHKALGLHLYQRLYDHQGLPLLFCEEYFFV